LPILVTGGNVRVMAITAAHLIDEKGGPTAVAATVGKSPGAVRVWKHRDRIPRESWPEIMKAYPDVTLERLIATEGSARSSSVRQVA
jgi:hypothetical protein